MADQVAPKKKLATPLEREIVIGTAAKSLSAAVVAIGGLIEGLNETISELDLKIENKQEALDDLNEQFKHKERQHTIDLNLKIAEQGIIAATEILNAQGKTAIDKTALATLQNELNTLKQNYKDDLNKANAAIYQQELQRWTNEKALLEATHQRNEAENKASIGAQTLQINMLKAQNEMLIKQIDAEREAGVKRAQANVAPIVNVGNQGR